MADIPTIKKDTKTSNDGPPPMIVVDIGKRQKKKRIRRLRKGKGKLMDKITDLVEEMRQGGALEPNAQAVVIVVRQKSSDRGPRY